jgi:hypothetical protein
MFSLQESGSDFASVVQVQEHLAPWRQLDDSDSIALLHRRFWGTSMAIEEQAWRRTQSSDPAIDEDGDQDGDDIIPGCYLLDIGMNISKLWIRADYIRIYDFLEAHYKKPSAPSFRAPAAVVTGQPGVGEDQDAFVNLRLTQSLSERKKHVDLLRFASAPR